MPNHRNICPYCKTEVLNRIIGSHILKKHGAALFAEKANLKALHSDSNFRKPILFHITDEESSYFCLADNSCIKKEPLADKHFKGRADAHRAAMLKLRESYPLDGQTNQTVEVTPVVSDPLLTPKDKDRLQDFIMDCYASSDVALSREVRLVLKKLGLKTESEELRELFPEHEKFLEEDALEAAAQGDHKEEQSFAEEEPPYEPPAPAPIPAPIQETPVLPPPQPVMNSQPRLPGATVEQTAKFLEMFPPDSKDFQKLFTSVTTNKYQGVPPEVAALMYKSSSLQREPAPSFGNLIQNTKTIQKAQRVQKPPL